MDKGRHPKVVRTWKVERTKTLTRSPQKPQRKQHGTAKSTR